MKNDNEPINATTSEDYASYNNKFIQDREILFDEFHVKGHPWTHPTMKTNDDVKSKKKPIKKNK